jgi:hypothetical protein
VLNYTVTSAHTSTLTSRPSFARSAIVKSNGCLDDSYTLWHLGLTGTRHDVMHFCGVVAVAMFGLLALGGVGCVRRNYFELFYKSHLITALVGLLLLFITTIGGRYRSW